MHHPPPHDHLALIMELLFGLMMVGFGVLMLLFPWEYGKMAGDFYAPAKAWTGWRRYLAGLAAMIIMLLFVLALIVVGFGPGIGLAYLSILLTAKLPFVHTWADGDQVMLRSALAIICLAGWMAAFFRLLNHFTDGPKKAV